MEPYYWGYRDRDDTAQVRRGTGGGGHLLRLRLDLDNHSPTGFEWGYGGSGPAQLALAILADTLHDDARALHLHQHFKWRVIAKLPRRERWMLKQAEVLEHVLAIERALAVEAEAQWLAGGA